MLVVFCENLLEIILSFVVGGSKFAFFVGQNLNSRIIFILRRREYILSKNLYLSRPPPVRRAREHLLAGKKIENYQRWVTLEKSIGSYLKKISTLKIASS